MTFHSVERVPRVCPSSVMGFTGGEGISQDAELRAKRWIPCETLGRQVRTFGGPGRFKSARVCAGLCRLRSSVSPSTLGPRQWVRPRAAGRSDSEGGSGLRGISWLARGVLGRGGPCLRPSPVSLGGEVPRAPRAARPTRGPRPSRTPPLPRPSGPRALPLWPSLAAPPLPTLAANVWGVRLFRAREQAGVSEWRGHVRRRVPTTAALRMGFPIDRFTDVTGADAQSSSLSGTEGIEGGGGWSPLFRRRCVGPRVGVNDRGG